MLGVLIVGLYGLIFGSFVTAVVWRIYAKKSVVHGRSMCPSCKHTLGALDLVPVMSWIWLRGKCRYCKHKISAQYPATELATGLAFALSYAALQPTGIYGWLMFGLWLYFVVSFMILAVYDLKWLILPDVVVLPAIGVAVVRLALQSSVGHDTGMAISEILAAIAVGGAFYGIAWISKGKWLGGGDIKLVFLMGLLLGLPNTALAMLLAFNVAAIVGVLLILTKIKSRKDYIPFGPFLVGATIIAMLYGSNIIRFYLSLNGLGLS